MARSMKHLMAIHTLILIAVSSIPNAVGQSNYASHANNVDYLGKGLPEEATLDGKVNINDIQFHYFFALLEILKR